MQTWNRLLVAFLEGVIRSRRQALLSLAAVRGAHAYLGLVEGARQACIGLLAALCGIVVLLTGFVLMHVAVLMLLPWSLRARGCIALAWGAAYVAGILLFLRSRTNTTRWLRMSRADRLVERCERLR